MKKDFSKAFQLNPKDKNALFTRANIAMEEAQYESAAHDFEKAIKIDDEFGKAFMGLGLAALAMEQKEQACQALRRADKLGVRNAKIYLQQNSP